MNNEPVCFFHFQKLAFMVSLGLVTHDHLEGKLCWVVLCRIIFFVESISWMQTEPHLVSTSEIEYNTICTWIRIEISISTYIVHWEGL